MDELSQHEINSYLADRIRVLAQGGVLGLQRSHILKQLQHQPLEIIKRQRLNIW